MPANGHLLFATRHHLLDFRAGLLPIDGSQKLLRTFLIILLDPRKWALSEMIAGGGGGYLRRLLHNVLDSETVGKCDQLASCQCLPRASSKLHASGCLTSVVLNGCDRNACRMLRSSDGPSFAWSLSVNRKPSDSKSCNSSTIRRKRSLARRVPVLRDNHRRFLRGLPVTFFRSEIDAATNSEKISQCCS